MRPTDRYRRRALARPACSARQREWPSGAGRAAGRGLHSRPGERGPGRCGRQRCGRPRRW
eukprot:3512887-Lingulodinium_polyedra.AAC.1